VIASFNPPLQGVDADGKEIAILAVALGPPRPGPDWADTQFLVISTDATGWKLDPVRPHWLPIAEVRVNQ
jgi:hypothetical protein